MKIMVYTLKGTESTAWDLNDKVLGKASPALLSQALRVYQSNAHQGTSAVKTRGEVNGSTRKIYRQKGTGNARHGAKYAPVFVGGGIAHGPKSIRPQNLRLPKAMRRRALATAMLLKLNEKSLTGLLGVSKATGKTSSAVKLLSSITNHPNNKVLIVTKNLAPKLFLMVRSLQGVTMKLAAQVSAYDLVANDAVLLTRPALDALVARTQKPAGDTV
jgi:large subunit ribosomal protein L4